MTLKNKCTQTTITADIWSWKNVESISQHSKEHKILQERLLTIVITLSDKLEKSYFQTFVLTVGTALTVYPGPLGVLVLFKPPHWNT